MKARLDMHTRTRIHKATTSDLRLPVSFSSLRLVGGWIPSFGIRHCGLEQHRTEPFFKPSSLYSYLTVCMVFTYRSGGCIRVSFSASYSRIALLVVFIPHS
ncbi:hypothetical protein CC2G_014706 [Coprinopsis cinerea AmutBmut pab1-1]|nr:hypothetical protein CC2G_014706 [Coprinopsis cinerea AmutBmut pab1-1]